MYRWCSGGFFSGFCLLGFVLGFFAKAMENMISQNNTENIEDQPLSLQIENSDRL